MKFVRAPKTMLVAATDPQAIALMRETLCTAYPGVTLHGASDAGQAESVLKALAPDWLLLDLNLLDVLRAEIAPLLEGKPCLTLVAIASHSQDDRILPALRFGAAGFVVKRDEPEEIAQHLAWIAQGYRTMTRALAGQLLRELDWTGLDSSLAESEKELLAWIYAGDTPVEAAARMKLGPGTVDRTVAEIWRKAILIPTPIAGPVLA